MKLTKSIVGLLIATSGFASAATVVYSGNGLTNVQGSVPGDLTTGHLGLIVVDTGAAGFGALAGGITSVSASLTVGGTFGGDLIIGRISSSSSVGDARLSGNFSWNTLVAPVSTRWAIVWFDTLTFAGPETNAANGTHYGMASATDWVTPSSEPATGQTVLYSTAPTGTQIRTLILNNGGSASSLPTGAEFATNGTTLSVIPEPSAALLGALGALGLLRRRRI